MLKDFLNWVDKSGVVVVHDHTNERLFSRPLTNLEKSYMIDNNISLAEVVSWPATKKAIESRKLRNLVEGVN